MDDRELLEKAAKAAGMETMWDQPRGAKYGRLRARIPGEMAFFPLWNPLEDDGEALRLAVRLRIDIGWIGQQVAANTFCEVGDYAATRRAIVRAAAAIGEQQ